MSLGLEIPLKLLLNVLKRLIVVDKILIQVVNLLKQLHYIGLLVRLEHDNLEVLVNVIKLGGF